MTDFTKEFNQLYKAYDKRLKKDHTTSFKGLTNCMEYFVNYLRFMRDYYILTEPQDIESGEENLKIASLATAISEYEKYQNCERAYFEFDGTNMVYKVAGTPEEVHRRYNMEKNFHWTSFWDLVRLNMEDWMPNA